MKGGSPTAFERLIVRSRFSDQSASLTLNSRGRSEANGILYVDGAWVRRRPSSSHQSSSVVSQPTPCTNAPSTWLYQGLGLTTDRRRAKYLHDRSDTRPSMYRQKLQTRRRHKRNIGTADRCRFADPNEFSVSCKNPPRKDARGPYRPFG